MNMQSNSHDLFFAPAEKREFQSILSEVQEYISSKYAALLVDARKDDVKQQIKFYIQKYLSDNRITANEMSDEELVNRLYVEMAEFSFLTKYIFGSGIEEIDINAWNDIEIYRAGGMKEKLDERFESPQHAINVVRRMLHTSGMVLDNASPAVLGHLSKNIRISALKTPLVDEDVGVCASIRIVNPQNFDKEDFVKSRTATEPMLEFLSQCFRYGVSTCVAGATGSVKTTIAGWMLSTIPNDKRIYTIESGSRELALARRNDDETILNSVIHTLARPSENEMQNIDQDILLDYALRFNPDYICVGEMRGPEAFLAQEASRTGHPVLTTIHSNSCEATYRRMATLCKRKYDMAEDVLLDLVTEAFPLVAFSKQLENRERKLMEIMECEIKADGTREYRTIYRYHITENKYDDKGKFIIKGRHEFVSEISKGLQKRLTENGMPKGVLDKICRGEAINVC